MKYYQIHAYRQKFSAILCSQQYGLKVGSFFVPMLIFGSQCLPAGQFTATTAGNVIKRAMAMDKAQQARTDELMIVVVVVCNKAADT